MPNERSSFSDRVDSLDMAYHVARFLQPNGKTRAEVYFAARAGALAFSPKAQSSLTRLGYPAPRRYLVSGFGRAYGRRFQSDTARVARRLLGEVAPDRAGPVQSVALAELSGLFHLGLQFQQRVVEEVSGDSVVTTGPRVRLSTERVDSLSALPSSAGGLAMSDLRPMVLPRRLVGELPVGGLALRKATRQLAYPFEKILPSVPLALYFEAYHLNLGNGDQTRYTVEYEIFRRTEASGLRGLFGGEDQQRTTTETTYNGTSRTAREMILIDLADVKELEPGSELAVTVRVTDEVTGETKERRVAFTVAEPPPEG